MGGYLAWKARGRKERHTPYSPEKGAQPRMITRDEWHDVVNVVNAYPGLSERVKGIDGRLRTLEERTGDMTESLLRLETGFAAHVDRWEEVGVDAREHRQRIEAQLLRLEEKVDRRGDR